MNRKVVLWTVTGCGILCLGTILFVILVGGSFLKWVAQEPENIEVEVIVPAAVSLNEEALLLVEITNLAAEDQTLDSVDIDLSYLDGFNVDRTEPEYSDMMEASNAFSTYDFQTPIPAGRELEIRFYMTAKLVGERSGEIRVCINWLANCANRSIRTIVEE
jgi:hypothetical protein